MPAPTVDGSMASEAELVSTVLITYAIGTTQYYPMLLEDICDIRTGELVPDGMAVLVEPIEMMHN
jgi:hypothetical protein